jgi:hypothetical protein
MHTLLINMSILLCFQNKNFFALAELLLINSKVPRADYYTEHGFMRIVYTTLR